MTRWHIIKRGKAIAHVEAVDYRTALAIAQEKFGHGVGVVDLSAQIASVE